MKSLFINKRFYLIISISIFLMILGYVWPWILPVGQFLCLLLLVASIFEGYLLFSRKKGLEAERICTDRLSNGDDNEIKLSLSNQYGFEIFTHIFDDIPPEFQRRDINFYRKLDKESDDHISYYLKPTRRGVYQFGRINILVTTIMGLVSRKYSIHANKSVKVYPGFLQLRKYELMAISNDLVDHGIKKVRKLGHNMEFEHIKEYVEGDDFRTINWKATARHNMPMVNVYQDEKSQNVYSVIDKGRVMKMPFEGMSLLDYAINASLVISNIAVKKEDKAGLISFEKDPDTFLSASRRSGQMKRILETLYKEDTTFGESDFSKLFVKVEREVRQRSLLLLYTNFESLQSMERQLNFFKRLATRHVLVVIFFFNTELEALTHSTPRSGLEIYNKVIAEKFVFEKHQIVRKLNQYGIYSILTTPQNLTVDVINKYLEMKARRII